MTKALVAAIIGVLFGGMFMALVSKHAAGARDQAIVATYVATQIAAARKSIEERDLLQAERYQRNAIDAAARGPAALTMDIAPWTLLFPVGVGVIQLVTADGNQDAAVRKQQEIGLRRGLAEILEQLGRGEEAAKEKRQAEPTKK